jgi:hypothetical protein
VLFPKPAQPFSWPGRCGVRVSRFRRLAPCPRERLPSDGGFGDSSLPYTSRLPNSLSVLTTARTADAFEEALRVLSVTDNVQVLHEELGTALAALNEHADLMQGLLGPTYLWLVTKLECLRGRLAEHPTPRRVQAINDLATRLRGS